MYEIIVYLEDQGAGPVLVTHHVVDRVITKEELTTFTRAHISRELVDNDTVTIGK